MRFRAWALWVLGPLSLAGAAFAVAHAVAGAGLLGQPKPSDAARDPGEALLARALENLVWAHGSPADVRDVLRRIEVTSGDSAQQRERAVRTRLRLAVVAQTSDARAALLSEVCALEPLRCDSLPQELERVAATRKGQPEYHLLAPPSGDR